MADDPLTGSGPGAGGEGAAAGRGAESASVAGLLRALLRPEVVGERVSVGEVVEIFGRRGLAVVMVILAFLNIVLAPLPMVSVILGLPLVLVAGQMTLGRGRPALPSWLARRSIGRAELERGVAGSIVWIERVERLLRPRLAALCGPRWTRAAAMVCLLLSVILFLPIPFGNIPPAAAIMLLGLGVLRGDGVFVAAGMATAATTAALFGAAGALLVRAGAELPV